MTAAEKAFCENWCKAHVNTWQVLNRSQWKYTFHPKALVRYVEEVRQTEAEICLILEYLASDDCIATLSLYDQGVGGSWKPIRAWLETGNKSVQGVRSVRLYHGLQWTVANEDSWYVIEDGCSQKVSVKYYWNASEVIDVRGMSSSGVSYRICGLQRDPETGLFNYMLEKVERKQQDLPEYLSGTTVYEDTKEEAHLGVREGVSAGKQASVNNGTIVRRKESKNADCTHNVENTTVTEKKVEKASETVHVALTGETVTTVNKNMPSKASTANLDIGESVENTETEGGLWNQVIRKVTRRLLHLSDACRKTVFAHTHSTSDVQGTNPGFTHVTDASGGVVRSKSVSRTSDGGYKVDEDVTTEQPVTGASVGWHKTLRGTTKTQTDRAQQNPVTSGGMRVGETRRSEKTEGGLWNNTNEVFDGTPAGELGEACERSSLEHTHSTTTNVADKPTVEASAGVNVRRSVSAQRTEVDTWDKTERVTTFEPKRVTTTDGTAVAQTTTVVGVNQPSVPSGGAGGVNESRRVSASMNDHGSYSTHEETTVFQERNASATTGSALATKVVRVEKNNPNSTVSDTPSQNKTVEASITPNEHGSYDKHVTVTTHHPASASANTGTALASKKITVEKNATSATISESPSQNKSVEASISPNDHGSYDKHITVTTHKTASASANTGSTVASRTIKVERNSTSSTIGDTPAQNRTVEASITPNDHGSYDKHVTVTNFSSASGTATSDTATATAVTKVTINDTNGAPQGFHASVHPNEHGSFTTNVTTVTPKAVDSGWITWESVTRTHSSRYTYECGIRVFENLSNLPNPKNGTDCSISVRINEHGLYCGQMHYRKLKSWSIDTEGTTSSSGKKYWLKDGDLFTKADGKNYQNWKKMYALYVDGPLTATNMSSYSENAEKVGRIGRFFCFFTVIARQTLEEGQVPS